MPSFVDVKGREFEATVTLSTAIKLQKIGVDLNKPMDIAAKLGADFNALGSTIYLVCEASILKHGLTQDTFVEALEGDGLAAATDAVWEAIVLFSQPPIRAALRKMWSKGAEVTRLATEQVETAIDMTTADQILTSLKHVGNSLESAE